MEQLSRMTDHVRSEGRSRIEYDAYIFGLGNRISGDATLNGEDWRGAGLCFCPPFLSYLFNFLKFNLIYFILV